MPIFSYRALRGMLDAIAPFLEQKRVRDLEGKMRSTGEQLIPAEWEIAVGHVLSRVGAIADPGEVARGNPDYLFTPRGSAESIVVEVTTLSDRKIDEVNPIEPFTNKLASIVRKHLIAHGSLDWRVGNGIVENQIVLGLPERKRMDDYFRAAAFWEFIGNIKATPTKTHEFNFVEKGYAGKLTFEPGKKTLSGGHIFHKNAPNRGISCEWAKNLHVVAYTSRSFEW
jgi:hypothetical protein